MIGAKLDGETLRKKLISTRQPQTSDKVGRGDVCLRILAYNMLAKVK